MTCGASEEFAHDLTLAVDEVCSNVVSHAYGEAPPADADFTVECRTHSRTIDVVVKDAGMAFDSATAPVPALPDWLARGQRGGIGLALVRLLVDSVNYRRIDGHNEITLSKSLDGASRNAT